MGVYFIAAGVANGGVVRISVGIGLGLFKILRQGGTSANYEQSQDDQKQNDRVFVNHG